MPTTVRGKIKSLDDEGTEFAIGLLHSIDGHDISITDDRFTDHSLGLPQERKEYLFKNIREYCSNETKDLLCPEPENMTVMKVGRPKKVVEENANASNQPAKTRGRPRKEIAVENGVANHPPAKKRGRPAKTIDVENGAANHPPAKKRNRPAKTIGVENGNVSGPGPKLKR